jgi:peptidoglycan/LPS O-acetylase OafA/YrhL
MSDHNSYLNIKDRFSNNFDLLRLLAAFLVILSHSYPLSTGSYNGEPLVSLSGGAFTLGNLGVMIFFVISGYLITSSWLRKPNFSGFFKNRILRIVPGLFGLALVTIFIIGPLVTIIPVVDYLKNPWTWWYFHIVTIYYVWGFLPGVFVNNVYPNDVNGSLWILGLLFTMYVVVSILGFIGFLKKKGIILIITILLSVSYLMNYNGTTRVTFFAFSKQFFDLIYYNKLVWMLSLDLTFGTILFMIGVLIFLYRDRIKYDVRICIFLAILWTLSLKTPLFSLISFIALPYIILYIAFARIPYLSKAGKYGDFSYGIYIYAFPIQQSIEHFLPGISVIGMFLLSLLIVIPTSIISYKFIESKALKLKYRNIKKTMKLSQFFNNKY